MKKCRNMAAPNCIFTAHLSSWHEKDTTSNPTAEKRLSFVSFKEACDEPQLQFIFCRFYSWCLFMIKSVSMPPILFYSNDHSTAFSGSHKQGWCSWQKIFVEIEKHSPTGLKENNYDFLRCKALCSTTEARITKHSTTCTALTQLSNGPEYFIKYGKHLQITSVLPMNKLRTGLTFVHGLTVHSRRNRWYIYINQLSSIQKQQCYLKQAYSINRLVFSLL